MKVTPPPLAMWLLSHRLSDDVARFRPRRSRGGVPCARADLGAGRTSLVLAPGPALHARAPARTLAPDGAADSSGDSMLRTLVADVRYGSGFSPALRRSPSRWLACLRSDLARTPRCSASSTPCCCGPCPSKNRNASCACSTSRRRRRSRAFTGSPSRPRTITTGSGPRVRSTAWRCTGFDSSRCREVESPGPSSPVRWTPTSSRSCAPSRHSAGHSGPTRTAPARGHVAILSDGFWRSHFGGAGDVVGRTLTLDGDVYTVIGVMPARFTVRSWDSPPATCGYRSRTRTSSAPFATITTPR